MRTTAASAASATTGSRTPPAASATCFAIPPPGVLLIKFGLLRALTYFKLCLRHQSHLSPTLLRALFPTGRGWAGLHGRQPARPACWPPNRSRRRCTVTALRSWTRHLSPGTSVQVFYKTLSVLHPSCYAPCAWHAARPAAKRVHPVDQ